MSMYMGKRDEYGTEHGKHQCLDEANKNFKKHHKNTHSDTYNGHQRPSISVNGEHYEYDACQ